MVELAGFTRICVGSLRFLELPATVQRYALAYHSYAVLALRQRVYAPAHLQP